MKKGILLIDIVNTVLDVNVTMAHRGDIVMVLEDHGSHYEVAHFDGSSPSTTFYVRSDQVRIDYE